jgi:hypothetical protein
LDEAEQRKYRDGQQHEHDNGHATDAKPVYQAICVPLRFLDTTPTASLRDLCSAVRGVTAADAENVQFANCRVK